MAPFTKKEGEEAYGKAALYGKPFTGRDGPYEKAGPYEQGRSLRKGPGCRTAHGKLRGGTLPELGGNFRLCAVNQKRPFFPRVGPFLALLPFKGPYGKPLTGEGRSLREGSLTGRSLREGPVPYGKGRGPLRVLHREGRRRGLREGRALMGSPLQEERSLREGPVLTGRATGRQGVREAPYKEERSLREGPVLTRLGPFIDKNDL